MPVPGNVTVLGHHFVVQAKDLLRHDMISELDYGGRIIWVDETLSEEAAREAITFEIFTIVSCALLTDNQLTDVQKKALTAAACTIQWGVTPERAEKGVGLLRKRPEPIATPPAATEPTHVDPGLPPSTTQLPLLWSRCTAKAE